MVACRSKAGSFLKRSRELIQLQTQLGDDGPQDIKWILTFRLSEITIELCEKWASAFVFALQVLQNSGAISRKLPLAGSIKFLVSGCLALKLSSQFQLYRLLAMNAINREAKERLTQSIDPKK